MKKEMTEGDIMKMYFEKFGEYPSFSGEIYFEHDDMFDMILTAIKTGVPINQRDVADGVDI